MANNGNTPSHRHASSNGDVQRRLARAHAPLANVGAAEADLQRSQGSHDLAAARHPRCPLAHFLRYSVH